MPDTPAVTVCIPAWNAARFLPETLASLRAQTFVDWELVVVEDGTDDGTKTLVETFARGGPQPVRFVRHEVNRGLPSTRNTAIAAARAPWVALLDSDDLWLPTHLEDLVATAARTGRAAAFASVELFDDASGNALGERHPPAGWETRFPEAILRGALIIQPSALLIRRDPCLGAGAFDPTMRFVEDRDFYARQYQLGTRFAWTGKVGCRYRQHAGAMTRKAAEMAVHAAKVTERHAGWDALPPGLGRKLAAEAWIAAGRIQWRSRPDAAAEAFARAAKLRPLSPTAAAGRIACAVASLTRRGARV